MKDTQTNLEILKKLRFKAQCWGNENNYDALSWAISLLEREEIFIKWLDKQPKEPEKKDGPGGSGGMGYPSGSGASYEIFVTEKKEPVDLGVDSTCDVCGLQKCICPERLFNGDWKDKEELPPIEKLKEESISLREMAEKIDEVVERSNTHSKLINQLRKK